MQVSHVEKKMDQKGLLKLYLGLDLIDPSIEKCGIFDMRKLCPIKTTSSSFLRRTVRGRFSNGFQIQREEIAFLVKLKPKIKEF